MMFKSKKTEKKQKNDDRIQEGEILVSTIIEIIGKPREHVEETIKEYVKKIEAKGEYSVRKKKIAKAKKYEGQLFSAYAELEIVFKNITQIHFFCFEYMPASIEILEPERIIYQAAEITAVINEFQSKLHQVDMVLKEMRQINENMNHNFTNLLSNHILLTLKDGQKSIEQIEKLVGIKSEKMQQLLKIMESKKLIRNKADKYELNL